MTLVSIAALLLAAVPSRAAEPPRPSAEASSPGSGASAGSTLRLTVWMEREAFVAGEPLALHVRWDNPAAPGGPTVRVNKRGLLHAETLIEVRDAADRDLPIDKKPEGRGFVSADFAEFGPGDSVEYIYSLDYLLARYPEPGRYSAAVRYRTEAQDGGGPVWSGTLAAGPVRFRIKAPPPTSPSRNKRGRKKAGSDGKPASPARPGPGSRPGQGR